MSDHLKDLYKAASKGFLTSETCGPNGKYLYVCRFRNMADLHAYEDAWRAAMLAVRDGGSMRQVPDGRAFQPGDRVEWQSSFGTWFTGKIVAVRDRVTTYDAKLDDGCDAEDFAAGRFRKIDPAPPTSWDVQECPDCVVTEWATGYKCAECQGGACPTPAVCAAVIAKREPTPAQAGAELPPHVALALDYSRNFANAKPDIGTTEREHIVGLCNLLEKAYGC